MSDVAVEALQKMLAHEKNEIAECETAIRSDEAHIEELEGYIATSRAAIERLEYAITALGGATS